MVSYFYGKEDRLTSLDWDWFDGSPPCAERAHINFLCWFLEMYLTESVNGALKYREILILSDLHPLLRA